LEKVCDCLSFVLEKKRLILLRSPRAETGFTTTADGAHDSGQAESVQRGNERLENGRGGKGV
jgi:hypothetical protein